MKEKGSISVYGTTRRFESIFSLRVRIFAVFSFLTVFLLLVLNIYPIRLIRNQMIRVKEGDMRASIGALSAAMESSGIMDYETATTAVNILDVGRSQRVLVTNAAGKVIYDNLKSSGIIGKTLLFPEIISALKGVDIFHCQYDREAFRAKSAYSVMREGVVVGVVYAYEYDTESAEMLIQAQNDILRLSAVAVAVIGGIIMVFTTGLRREFDVVLEGVNQIGQGNFEHRIELGSRDEMAIIAGEFNQMAEYLSKNEEVRRQFVSDASHELKTPLASIKLLVDSILQAREIKQEDTREFLEDVSEEIDRLTRLTEGLLYLSRLETVSSDIERCDLVNVVNKCAERLRPLAGLNNVTIARTLPQSAIAVASSDMAYQVVFNLLENAVKYNREGGKIFVNLSSDEGRVILAIADTGIGMKEEELSRVFDRFYRVDKPRARQTGGAGLGLSIAFQCIEALGGHIEVTSTYGEGSCFTAYFAAPAEEESI